MRRAIAVSLAFLGGALLVPGCFFNYMDDCTYNIGLSCFWENAGGTAGTAGSAGSAGADPECIPSEAKAPIADDCGAFVSPTGDDNTGNGTKAKPFATITKALAEKSVIYLCAEDGKAIEDAVSVDGRVEVYGGLDCKEWAYDPSKKSGWTAPPDAVPLIVTGMDAKARIEDVAITARDAVKDGGSAIGVIAADDAALTMERCQVTAGNGKQGAKGEKPAGSGMAGAIGDNGQDGCIDAMSKFGGNAGTSMCEGMSQNGGNGGNGTTISGSDGSDGEPQPGPMPTDGVGGKGQNATACKIGEVGAEGMPGTPGAGGTALGELSAMGYTGVSGGPGKSIGSPGQGGGGGGGAKKCATMGFAGPGGGGGGSGGCGGMPGVGGGPGGASIALASVGAAVTLTDVTLTAGKGGEGGIGGSGQSGGLGGTGGVAGKNNGDLEAKACNGGDGGKGGNGGPGGGGRGGHSLGIAYKGAAPGQVNVMIQMAGAGNGGQGGDMVFELTAYGANGVACKTLSFEKGENSCQKK